MKSGSRIPQRCRSQAGSAEPLWALSLSRVPCLFLLHRLHSWDPPPASLRAWSRGRCVLTVWGRHFLPTPAGKSSGRECSLVPLPPGAPMGSTPSVTTSDATLHRTVSRAFVHLSFNCSLSCLSGLPVGFLGGSVGKESACNAGDLGLTHESGRSPAEGNGNPLQYSCLENPMDRGAWRATVHGVARVRHDLALSFFLSPASEFLAGLSAQPGPRRLSWEAGVHWAPSWVGAVSWLPLGAARAWVALASVSPSAHEKGWIQSICPQILVFFQWFYSNWLTKNIVTTRKERVSWWDCLGLQAQERAFQYL